MLLTDTDCGGDFLCNTYSQYFWLLGALLFVIVFNRLISKLVSKLLFTFIRKTKAAGKGELFLSLVLKPLQYFIVLETLFIGFETLNTPPSFLKEYAGISLHSFLFASYRLLLILNIAWIVSRISDFFISVMRHRAELTDDPWDDQLVGFFKDTLKVLVWSIAVFCLFAFVLHINITSLAAGAGIAGIAIAFAAQESLQNIFGSIAIFTEKPFIVGDLVEVNGVTGTIEKVGFRSTRVRTTEKSFLTIPNKNIVNNPITNLRLRTSRRLQINLYLSYNTSADTLHSIINSLKNYGQSHTKRNDEAVVAFNNFGSYAFEIWIEFYFDYMFWEQWMEVRSEVMFKILEIVKEKGGELAYPTQSIKMDAGDNKEEVN